MGCFSFGKRKIPENRTPENRSAQLNHRPDGSVASLATSPTSGGGGSVSAHGFGGTPVPLPPPDSAIQSNSTRKKSLKPILEKTELPDSGDSLRTGSVASSEEALSRPSNLSEKLRAREKQLLASSSRKQTTLKAFRLDELKAITKDFAIEGFLGEGGFGAVFKGYIIDPEGRGRMPVAVKVLNIDGNQGEKEWTTEVSFLGLLHHSNLVNLLGYCAEGDQRLLVYEFAANSSLEHALFHRAPGDSQLSWSRRIKIALGAAKGLAYLHEQAEHQVIYRDFKTSNILLDRNWEARLSDFGLARSGPEGDESHVTTRVVGTVGYAAPEYVMTGHLTSKSDVWGFGVVLLEILTGRLAVDKRRPKEEQNLVEWAEPYLENPCKLYRIMDPELGGRYSVKGAHMTATLVQQCLSKKAKARPKMTEVVQALLPIQDLHDMAGFTIDDLRYSVKQRTEMKAGRKPNVSKVKVEQPTAVVVSVR